MGGRHGSAMAAAGVLLDHRLQLSRAADARPRRSATRSARTCPFAGLCSTESRGFTSGIGRVGAARRWLRGDRAVHSGAARISRWGGAARSDRLVEHLVSAERVSWRYFRSRCWAEGQSQALVTEEVGAQGWALVGVDLHVEGTLPTGALGGLLEAVGGDSAGLLRSGAIVAGLLITSAGYLCGRRLAGR